MDSHLQAFPQGTQTANLPDTRKAGEHLQRFLLHLVIQNLPGMVTIGPNRGPFDLSSWHQAPVHYY